VAGRLASPSVEAYVSASPLRLIASLKSDRLSRCPTSFMTG
jgi:hypothetical protein